MLIDFAITNYLSFQDKVVFSMEPTKIQKHKEHLIQTKEFNVLSGGVIYGANASGKSNLIKALDNLRLAVITGDAEKFEQNFNKFKFSENSISEFEITFQIKENAYRFFLSVEGDSIIKERLSLIKAKTNKDKILYDRTKGDTSGELISVHEWYKFRSASTSRLLLWKFKDDGLLETDSIPGREYIEDCFTFFENIEIFSNKTIVALPKFYRHYQKDDFRSFLNKLLAYADVGITDTRLKDISLEKTKELFEPILKKIQGKKSSAFLRDDDNFYFLFAENGEIHGTKLVTLHKGAEFDTAQESTGTIKLIDLALGLYLYRQKSILFVLDELDCSLHPILVRNILTELLTIGPKSKSQILVTLHDTMLLDKDIWRFDEIWFTEKCSDASTDLYPLTTFCPRFDKSIDKDYLQGRYGAIPFLGGDLHEKL